MADSGASRLFFTLLTPRMAGPIYMNRIVYEATGDDCTIRYNAVITDCSTTIVEIPDNESRCSAAGYCLDAFDPKGRTGWYW